MAKVLIVSGFTETEINSFREIQYARALSARGYEVTICTSNQSYIWKHNRAGMRITNPAANDSDLVDLGVVLERRTPFIRIGDFLLFRVPLRLIKSADVVHVIEFRQGISVVVAAIARMLGKPVVYDHEQRGDRHYTWLHSIDSAFRRLLIRLGSRFPNIVRHTVHANRDHFLQNASSAASNLMFAPLAADGRFFFFDSELRARTRMELGINEGARVAVVSGKIDAAKRSVEAIRALMDAGSTVIVVGRVSVECGAELDQMASERLKVLAHSSPATINAIYSAADMALFTTFSISYWEALATGLTVLVPSTSFSRAALPEDLRLLFGDETMFDVVEEQYKKGADVYGAVKSALTQGGPSPRKLPRCTRSEFLWETKGDELAKMYFSLLQTN